MYTILNEVLDIRYIDENKEYQNKQITIKKTKILDENNLDYFKQKYESCVIIIYNNNSYLNKHNKQKYEYIIKSNLNKECTLKHVMKFFYLDYY